MKSILLDTHVLLFDVLFPDKLSRKAKAAISKATKFYCADISLWEIMMLLAKGKVKVHATTEDFLKDLLAARGIEVLPINAEIAAASQKWLNRHKDPSDLLIAATALCYEIPLITKDKELHKFPDIQCIW